MGDVLFLAHRIPYPPDKGDKIRSWHILKHISQRADVHLGAFVDDPADFAHARVLEAACKSVKLIELDPRERWKRAFAGWRRSQPLSIALYNDPMMRDWVRECLRANDIDRMFVFSGQMAPYAMAHVSENRQFVMDFVDIDSDKFAQYARESAWPKSRLYRREAELLGALERQVARHADVSLFVSDAETAMFRRIAGSYAHTVETLHNGVDLDYFRPDVVIESIEVTGAPVIVFTGAMDYRPNVDAVCWFVAEVLPLIRKVHPQATFVIVGGKPSKEVLALAEAGNVVITGRVPDVRPYLAAASVAVAPLRIARGIQNKVLEAMAMGRPVVATTAAWTGIDAEPNRDLVVRDDPADFAAAVVDVVDNTEFARTLAANGRAAVESRYAWPAQLQKLDRFLGLESLKDAA